MTPFYYLPLDSPRRERGYINIWESFSRFFIFNRDRSDRVKQLPIESSDVAWSSRSSKEASLISTGAYKDCQWLTEIRPATVSVQTAWLPARDNTATSVCHNYTQLPHMYIHIVIIAKLNIKIYAQAFILCLFLCLQFLFSFLIYRVPVKQCLGWGILLMAVILHWMSYLSLACVSSSSLAIRRRGPLVAVPSMMAPMLMELDLIGPTLREDKEQRRRWLGSTF